MQNQRNEIRLCGNDGTVIGSLLSEEGMKCRNYIYTFDGDKLGKKERKGGSGFGIGDGSVMYTLSVKDVHSVAVLDGEREQGKLKMPHLENGGGSQRCPCVRMAKGLFCCHLGMIERLRQQCYQCLSPTLLAAVSDNMPPTIILMENEDEDCGEF